MSNELILKLPDTGLALQAIIWGPDHVTRWNGMAFVAPSSIADAAWATGMLAMTEQLTADGTRTGTYVGNFPAAITAAGEYWCEFVAGASPTPGQIARGVQTVIWNGIATAMLTTAERTAIADSLLDRANGVETNKTLRQALRIIAAVVGGRVSGANTGVESFVGIDGATSRVRVTTDTAGNRTGVEYDPT